MADIFVSYAREDEARVAPLVQRLEATGLSVFWDRRIPPGKSWREHIGQALADAQCVIVAWSRHSIASSFVAEEADDARARGVLVPLLLDPVQPPLGFRSLQAAEWAGLDSADAAAAFDALLHVVRATLASAPLQAGPQAPAPLPAHRPRKHLMGMWLLAAAVLAGAAVAALRFFDADTAAPGLAITKPERSLRSRPTMKVVEALRPAGGGMKLTVEVTSADAALDFAPGMFVLKRRDDSLEPADSEFKFDTLPPASSKLYTLTFSADDGVVLLATFPGYPELREDLRGKP